MNKIKILPIDEAQKIAAGEIVERPSSVVKELIENSIDAKATNIILYVEKAGKKLLRVVDDGIGMSKEDAKLCFLPHATSKISSIKDLDHISSFGFRGEALASISAISKVKLTTRPKDQISGITIHFTNGTLSNVSEVAYKSGTDLQISELFYNTPARKKFLKQDETEWNQIQNIFHAFCFSNLSIHFKLYRDGKILINAPAVSCLKDRITQTWGHNFSENLVQLIKEKRENSKILITGLISNHHFWRYTRSQIFFFVNGRYVKNQNLNKALIKGYLNVLPHGKFPAVFIFINLPNLLVDINVHPRKEEVKFVTPKTIENNLQASIKNSLEQYVTKQLHHSTHSTGSGLTHSIDSKIGQAQFFNKGEIKNFNFDSAPFLNSDNSFEKGKLISTTSSKILTSPAQHTSNLSTSNIYAPSPNLKFEQSQKTTKTTEQIKKTEKQSQTPVPQNGKIIGQFLNTYILIEQESALVIIDQHAAHERILYEQFSKYFDLKDGTRLLFPEIITITEKQLKLALKEKDFFKKQGIEIEQFGPNKLVIKTSPPKIQSQSLKEIILEAISFMEENEDLERNLFYKKINEQMHSHMACKTAIKAGDILSLEEINNLIHILKQTNNRLICIHGRPTTWIIPKEELERKFKRRV